MALKDALSFISEKKSALDREKDSPQARPAPPVRSNPSNTEPSSQWTDSPSDPQPPRETPTDRGEISMECRRGEFTMEPMTMSPMQPRQRQKLLSRPLDMADGPGQDPEADQGLGVNSFKTIGGKPSRHRSTGGEHHCSSSWCSQSPPPRQSMQKRPQVQQYNITIQHR